jgi:hypothetical protein
MGWLYNTHPQPKKLFIDDVLRRNFTDDNCSLLASSLRGNRLWILARNKREDAPFIALFLLACYKGCWGYKDIYESMGPYYYDCPLSFLDQAPEPPYCSIDGHAGEPRTTWRDHVRRFHAAQAERRRIGRPKVGEELTLVDARFPGYGGTYRVTRDLGRRGVELNGYLRMKAHQLKWAERKTPALQTHAH